VKTKVSPLAYAVVGVVLALIALLAYGVLSNEPARGLDAAVARGERPLPPAFALPTLDGRTRQSLADYEGKVVVLNVWGSWCPPCAAESPLLERWHRKIAARGGTLLGINTLDVKSDALDFMKRYELTYPQLHDREGRVIAKLGIVAYPETFVVDRKGRLTAISRGEVDEKFMRDEVEPLL
jgi:cytochrome c biogenesis protein CcmG/thiol:disulfide interchange protein DsbE